MFSELPGLFDRKFVTGFLLPAILFAFGALLLFSYSFGIRWMQIALQPAADGASQIVIVKEIDSATFLLGLFALVSFVIAILLMVLNRIMIRFLEGYHPPFSWFRKRAVDKFEAFKKQKLQLDVRYKDEKKKFGAATYETRGERQQVMLKLAQDYPPEERLVLPTALGNVIRSAEAYSYQVYGPDIILLWPRLLPAMDSDYRDFLDDAKSSLDFSINLLYIASLLLLEALLFFSISPRSATLWPRSGILVILALGATIYISYRVAVSRAFQWGQYLRAASDLYLNKMLEMMGLEAPADHQKRFNYFRQLSQAITYQTALPQHNENPVDTEQNGVEGNPLTTLALTAVILGAVAVFLQAMECLMTWRASGRR